MTQLERYLQKSKKKLLLTGARKGVLSQHSPHIGFEDIALDLLSYSKDEILPCHHFCDYRGQSEVRGCLVDSTETQRE